MESTTAINNTIFGYLFGSIVLLVAAFFSYYITKDGNNSVLNLLLPSVLSISSATLMKQAIKTEKSVITSELAD